MLVVQNREKVWGEKRIGNKVDMLAHVVGYRHKINTRGDSRCMKTYLTRISKSELDMPTRMNLEQFLPLDAPLLDHLVYDYKKLEDLKMYQSNRGLNLGMREEIEVRELICGVSSEEEIVATRKWISRMRGGDQKSSTSNHRHPNVFCGLRAPQLVI